MREKRGLIVPRNVPLSPGVAEDQPWGAWGAWSQAREGTYQKEPLANGATASQSSEDMGQLLQEDCPTQCL